MQQLFKAILTHLADEDISSSVNGIFNGEVPEKMKYPYITFETIGSPNFFTYDSKNKEYLLKFVIYSDTKSTVEINTLYAELITALDNQQFDVEDHGFIECAEDNTIGPLQFDGIRQYDVLFAITLSSVPNVFSVEGSSLWDLIGIVS